MDCQLFSRFRPSRQNQSQSILGQSFNLKIAFKTTLKPGSGSPLDF
jgi:hypothetical protein